MRELIQELAEAWGPSGFEHHVRELIRAEVEPLADEVYVDALGNLICRIGDGERRVMTMAHMDEIGLIVSHIDQQGFARFASLGTLFPSTLVGARVRFENGVIGTIGMENQFTQRRNLPATGGFYIDISTAGTNDDHTDGDAVVQIGDPGAFVADVVWRGDRVIGKSLDDRLGCAIQIEVMRRIREQGTPHTLYFVFSVQEEVGSRGAGPAAFGIEPDLALVLDMTTTGDQPKIKPMPVKLGAGAAIKTRDTGQIVPAAVKNLIVQRADEAGIPYQFEVLELGSTDGETIQVARSGVPTGAISVPVRYVHTQSETADWHDIQAVTDLYVAVLSQDIDL
ncbi:MAG: M42 family metallopeptidase [Chloroflexi bacterium]|nr:M42 family metallopeptidase [Chloroflexota bacterium]